MTYNLNGPDLISGPIAADLWSRALGKPIKYPREDMDAVEAQMRQKALSWSTSDIRMVRQRQTQYAPAGECTKAWQVQEYSCVK